MRRHDTGWRDQALTAWHSGHGFQAPAAGMTLPMIEYDKGKPLAVVSYLRRGDDLPRGAGVSEAYKAFGCLVGEDGEQLPFFTVMYDPRNWAFAMKGHNKAARQRLYTAEWRTMTESAFVDTLFVLRGRWTPDLAPYGVSYSAEPWLVHEPEAVIWQLWPNLDMSNRRRNYEPVSQVRMSWRNPCLDIDFAVVDQDEKVALVVDYKAPGANLGLDSTNMKALAGLRTRYEGGFAHTQVAAMNVQYDEHADGWQFTVHCLNNAAAGLLAYALGSESDNVDALAATIVGSPVTLNEREWVTVLRVAGEV